MLVQAYVHVPVPVEGKSFASLALQRCTCIRTARHHFTLLATEFSVHHDPKLIKAASITLINQETDSVIESATDQVVKNNGFASMKQKR